VEEEAIPEDYEEDHYEEIDPILLARYILIGPDGTTAWLGYEEGNSEVSSSFFFPYHPSWKLVWGMKLGLPGGRVGKQPIASLP